MMLLTQKEKEEEEEYDAIKKRSIQKLEQKSEQCIFIFGFKVNYYYVNTIHFIMNFPNSILIYSSLRLTIRTI